uniref:Actin-related protein 8-like isoform X2 n=1 Tax=Rhizophora mucronata TaxID=61149 RepID=A0A2P2KTA9_RHIMU
MNNIIAREGGGRRGEKMRTLLVLLTNLWECLLLRNRPPGNSSCFSKTHHHHSASSSSSSLVIPIPPPPSYLGAFDRISIDVLMHILWLLGPKDAARLALVSKSWRSIVSDNRLWFHFLRQTLPDSDSLFFAETHLRSGYPLQFCTLPPSLLSLSRFTNYFLLELDNL